MMEGKELPDPKEQIKHQLYLDYERFITEHLQTTKKPGALREVSKAHKRSVALTLTDYRKKYTQRNEAMAKAYLSGAYAMAEIGNYFNVHYMAVSTHVKLI